MTFDALPPLADRAALFSALRQDQLVAAVDALGEHRWDADLEAGTITFSASADPSRRIVAGAELIASIAPGPRTVLWAWAHPRGRAGGAAARLRDYGTQHGLRALIEDETPFPADAGPDLDAWIGDAAHTIGRLTAEITGHAPYFAAPIGGGARAVLALDGVVPPLTVADALTALPRILASTTMTDPRTSVWDLARLAAWDMQWTDESYGGAVLRDATGSATFRFDDQARVSGVQGLLGGTPQA